MVSGHKPRAVRMVLESLVGKSRNHRVHWFTDNQNVVKIITTGSKISFLQKEALAIFSFADMKRNTSSLVTWSRIPAGEYPSALAGKYLKIPASQYLSTAADKSLSA